MHKFNQILDKKRKGGKELSDVEQQAKMNVVKNLKSVASDEMSYRLKDAKNAKVSSPSKGDMNDAERKSKEVYTGGDLEEMEEPKDSSPMDDSVPEYSKHSKVEDSESSEMDCESMSDDELEGHMAKLMHEKMKRQEKA